MTRPRGHLVLHALPAPLAERITDSARRQTLFALDIHRVAPGHVAQTSESDAAPVFDVYLQESMDRGRGSAIEAGRAAITVVRAPEEGDAWPPRDADASLIEDAISPDALATALYQAASSVIRRRGGDGPGDSLPFRCVPRRTFGQVLHHAISVAGRAGTLGYVVAVATLPGDEPAERHGVDADLTWAVLERMASVTRAADLVGLLGPCHFAILVETGSTLDGARTLIDRLRRALATPADGGPALDIHFGLTTFGAAADTPAAVLERADAALAQSLARGRPEGPGDARERGRRIPGDV